MTEDDRSDHGKWKAHARVGKYKGDFHSEAEAQREGASPFAVAEDEGNLLLNEGINTLFNILCGNGSETVFNNANARLGVGDSSTAAQATDTDLLGGNKLFKAMDATYPTSGSSQKATFKATFGSADANWAWNEWSVDNGGTALKNLNRKAPVTLGTKTSGETWVLTVDISLS